MDAATVTPPIGFGLRKTSEALVSLVFFGAKSDEIWSTWSAQLPIPASFCLLISAK